uniref:LRR binding FLII interacting protein 1 n=1 Tax=Oryctolagus cuniculus TaxID=9986 RepID=A0A5F9CSJ0_RABIT
MGTPGSGRKRLPTRERLTAEDDALHQIAREAEARLAAKRAARAEAREIRMKELERQQKEIYQVQKKYYGLDTKWGDIEQWMEDSERCSRRSRRTASSQPDMEYGRAPTWTNGYDAELCGAQSLSRRSGRGPSWSSLDPGLPAGGLAPRALSAYPGSRPSCLSSAAWPAGSHRASVFDDSSLTRARRGSGGGSYAPSEYSGHLTSSSRASSRASSARASPVVEERPEKDFAEKGSRNMPGLSAATLASLGGTSSRRGSGDTSISLDTEASIREIKELNELKDQIQDVEGKYMQGLKEMKDSLAEVEEKYKKAMVSNAQLDNEKTNFMYQVDTLKDMLLELEEELAESRRQYEEKSKEFEREKHAHSVLQFQFADVKEALRQREAMLEEIRQLQQKQASSLREISDLQETIEWKDKKIGALERQKEFFDSIRSERDDLREEVVTLKEALKKHGIILNSEAATNGETPDPPNNVGHPTKEEMGTLQSAGDGALDVRLKKLVEERECLLEQVKRLKGQLEEKQKNGKPDALRSEDSVLENGADAHVLDLQSKRQLQGEARPSCLLFSACAGETAGPHVASPPLLAARGQSSPAGPHVASPPLLVARGQSSPAGPHVASPPLLGRTWPVLPCWAARGQSSPAGWHVAGPPCWAARGQSSPAGPHVAGPPFWVARGRSSPAGWHVASPPLLGGMWPSSPAGPHVAGPPLLGGTWLVLPCWVARGWSSLLGGTWPSSLLGGTWPSSPAGRTWPVLPCWPHVAGPPLLGGTWPVLPSGWHVASPPCWVARGRPPLLAARGWSSPAGRTWPVLPCWVARGWSSPAGWHVAVLPCWPHVASPPLPVPRALDHRSRDAHEGAERGCAGAEPGCPRPGSRTGGAPKCASGRHPAQCREEQADCWALRRQSCDGAGSKLKMG